MVLVACLLRVVGITANPSGFFCDEAINVTNAYSIRTTLRDTEGKFMPVIFRALNDYRGGTFVYSLVPFLIFLPPDELAVRLGAAVYGIAAVILMFMLVRRKFGTGLALVVSAVLATTPWHIHYSRAGYEISCAVFWYLAAIYGWVWYRRQRSLCAYLVFVIAMVAAFFSYAPFRIGTTVLALSIVLMDRDAILSIVKTRRLIITTLGALCLMGIVLLPYVGDGTFFNRLNAVREPSRSALMVVRSYLDHFDFGFLFVHGEYGFAGSSVARQSLRDYGELHLFQSVFVVFGFLSAILDIVMRRKGADRFKIWVVCLMIYPMSSIFTTQIPSATHSINGVLPLAFFSGYGIYRMMGLLKRTRVVQVASWGMVLTVWFLSVWQYGWAYAQYPVYASGYYGWQYGYRQAMEWMDEHAEAYDSLLITHRFNAGEALLRMYQLKHLCLRCRVMSNPIKVNEESRELFALRLEDIEEANTLYPHLYFQPHTTIENHLGGPTELWIGTFKLHDPP